MSKIRKFFITDKGIERDNADGNYARWNDVVAGYHPLLRELRYFVNQSEPYLDECTDLIERIDELLNEDK